MDILFILLFCLATIFSVFMLITLATDIKAKSRRPIFIIGIALGAWFMTLPAFIAPTAYLSPQSSMTSYVNYYLNPSNSHYNSSDYFYSLNGINYATINQITSILPPATGHFKIAQFITNATTPDLYQVSPGMYQVHLHAYSNGSFTQLYSQLWVIGPNDNNLFMIGQTPLTQQLQANSLVAQIKDTEYITNFYVNQTTKISPNDRLALFIFANVSESFDEPINVTLYMGGYANPHVSIPSEQPAPIQTGLLWDYFYFWSFIVAIHFLVFILYYFQWFRDLGHEALETER